MNDCPHDTTSLAENWEDRYCVDCGKWLGKAGDRMPPYKLIEEGFYGT